MAASNNEISSSTRNVLQVAGNAAGDTVILLGQTGDGKSSIANALLNLDQDKESTRRYFKESPELTSCTDELVIRKGRWFGDATKEELTVIDTPGFLDSENRSNHYLVELVNMLEHFPQNRLRLILVTLSLTSPRSDSSYEEMLDIIDRMFGPGNGDKVWPHVMFVYTCANLLRDDPGRLQIKRDGWIEYLIRNGVQSPRMCEFQYGNVLSLEPLRVRFNELAPYTPEATTELVDFLRDNPAATMAEKIDQNKRWRDMQEEWTRKLAEAEAKNQETLAQLKKVEKRSARQEAALKNAMEKQKQLEDQVTELRNRPPQIIHVPSGGCLSGSSIVWTLTEGSPCATKISSLREGQHVATVDDHGTLCWSEVYFVEVDRSPSSMVDIAFGNSATTFSGSTQLTSEHIIFAAHSLDGEQPCFADASPVQAGKLQVGDWVFAAPHIADHATIAPYQVMSIGSQSVPDMWTVLVLNHRLLVDSVLLSSHVIDHQWGIEDNAALLFLYTRISPSFATSRFNKWICRVWDSIFEPLASKRLSLAQVQ